MEYLLVTGICAVLLAARLLPRGRRWLPLFGLGTVLLLGCDAQPPEPPETTAADETVAQADGEPGSYETAPPPPAPAPPQPRPQMRSEMPQAQPSPAYPRAPDSSMARADRGDPYYDAAPAGSDPWSRTEPLPWHPWPPEDPSSFATLSSFFDFGAGSASLYDVAQLLTGVLARVGYVELGYYAVPGGFALVTRLEAISSDGEALAGAQRYRLPSDRVDFSLVEYIRSLFFAPQGRYRYLAFLVTDQPYVTADRPLDERTALERLRQGGVSLPVHYRNRPFSVDHRVDVLIYEFLKQAADGDVWILRPGRIPPDVHLERTGLLVALSPFALWSR